jgi:hypothetical protein
MRFEWTFMTNEIKINPPSIPKSNDKEHVENKIPIPFNISSNNLEKIVKALHQAQADIKPVAINDICAKTGLKNSTVSRNMHFFEMLKIINIEEKTNAIKLTTEGVNYAKSLIDKDAEKEKVLLNKLFVVSYKHLVDYMSNQGLNLDFDKLFNHIKGLARIPDNPKTSRNTSPPYTTGILAFIRLLFKAGFVSQEVMDSDEKNKDKPKKIHGKSSKKMTKDEDQIDEHSVSNLEILRMGQIHIQLPKNDKNACENAKKLIDVYKNTLP